MSLDRVPSCKALTRITKASETVALFELCSTDTKMLQSVYSQTLLCVVGFVEVGLPSAAEAEKKCRLVAINELLLYSCHLIFNNPCCPLFM